MHVDALAVFSSVESVELWVSFASEPSVEELPVEGTSRVVTVFVFDDNPRRLD